MLLKGRTSRKIFYTVFLALDISLFTQLTAFLPSSDTTALHRGRYVNPAPVVVSVADDHSKFVQRVYVDGILDWQVVQQPKDDTNYVSSDDDALTEFASVSQYGNIGLLAHNYLAGKSFLRLKVGQEISVWYSTGETEVFVVTEILRYQALDPKSPYSSFQNLKDDGQTLSSGQMFDRVYKGNHHLTFQTCIAKDGMSSWGRLFVLAIPKPAVTS